MAKQYKVSGGGSSAPSTSRDNGSRPSMDPKLYNELKEEGVGMTQKQAQAIATAIGTLRAEMKEGFVEVNLRFAEVDKKLERLNTTMYIIGGLVIAMAVKYLFGL